MPEPAQIEAWIAEAMDDYGDGVRPEFRMVEVGDLAHIHPVTEPVRLARRRADWDISRLTPIRLRNGRLDGNHRLTIARERGIRQLPALVWPDAA